VVLFCVHVALGLGQTRFYALSATHSAVLHQRQIKIAIYAAMSRSVLIADDSASMRRSVRFLLERRRTELLISEAVDGVDAIQKARDTKPDLILLDLAMPRLNGVEAASILKYILPQTPIILFTMFTDLHADSLSAFIAVDFVSKVDGVPRLLERVDTLLPPIASDDGAALH
jgi:CheY-like chemotaxis protein